MRNIEILRKRAELERLEESRQKAANRIKEISHDIHRLEQVRHRQRIFRAGEVVAKAGLLETFNPEELYAVLVENRERISAMGDEEVPYAMEE